VKRRMTAWAQKVKQQQQQKRTMTQKVTMAEPDNQLGLEE